MEVKYLQVVKKENIFNKVINFFRKAFYKPKQDIQENVVSDEKANNKNEFLNQIKLEHEEDPILIELQRKFEDKEVELSQLSKNQIHELNLLYKKQIDDLEKELDNKKTELNIIKNRVKAYAESI